MIFVHIYILKPHSGGRLYPFGVRYVHSLFISEMWSNHGSKASSDNAAGCEGITRAPSSSGMHLLLCAQTVVLCVHQGGNVIWEHEAMGSRGV